MSEDNPLFRSVQQQMSQNARIQTLESVESTFDMRTAAAHFQLPGLRGFWPMSAIQSNGDAFDQSGNGRLLTYNGNPTYNTDILAPYIDLDGVGDYLNRADEAGLDILGTETYVAAATRGIAIGGWFYPEAIPDAVAAALIGKSDMNVVANVSYMLSIQPVGANFNITFQIGSGAALETVTFGTVQTFGAWYHIVGYWIPSTTLAVVVNGASQTQASAFAALGNSGSQLTVGGASGGAIRFLDGRASMCFLCVQSLGGVIIRSLFNQTRQLFQV